MEWHLGKLELASYEKMFLLKNLLFPYYNNHLVVRNLMIKILMDKTYLCLIFFLLKYFLHWDLNSLFFGAIHIPKVPKLSKLRD